MGSARDSAHARTEVKLKGEKERKKIKERKAEEKKVALHRIETGSNDTEDIGQ